MGQVRIWVCAVALVMAGWAVARPVTPTEAQTAAMAWVARNGALAESMRVAEVPVPVTGEAGALLYYKVPFAGGGMVVTAADTRLEPIVAAVPGSPGAEIPAGHPLAALLKADAVGRLEALSGTPVALGGGMSPAESRWADLTGTGVRILSDGNNQPARIFCLPEAWRRGRCTHWNQSSANLYGTWTSGSFYDRYTPNHYPAGCVAVVGASLLQYFGVTGPVDDIEGACFVDGVYHTPTLPRTFYDWTLLPEAWESGLSLGDTAKELAGRVLRDVGFSVGMRYTASESSAALSSLAQCLMHRYGFASAKSYSGVTAACYAKLIESQTRCGRPVALGIAGNGGHAVLAVGYGEDEAGTGYSRIFMGWGGAWDAWYVLPDVGAYTAVTEVVTMISSAGSGLPVYGQVKDAEGVPLAWGTVTVDGIGEVILGAHGQYGVILPEVPESKSVTVTCGRESRSVTFGDALFSPDIGSAPYAAQAMPGPADFTAEAETLPVLTDFSEARAEALGRGVPLFVLSGPETSEGMGRVLAVLRGLDSAFGEGVVLWFCDGRTGESGMASEALRYGVFDPRTLDPTAGWEENKALAEGNSSDAASVASVLKAADWAVPSVTEVRVAGPGTVLAETGYGLLVTYSDGVTQRLAEGPIWSLSGDTAAAALSQKGVLTPGGTSGTVVLRAAMSLFGQAVAAELRVRVGSAAEVTALSLDHLPDELDLETEGDYRFVCKGTLADGSEAEVPAVWTVSYSMHPTNPGASIGSDGRMTMTAVVYSRLYTVTAAYNGLTASARMTVYPTRWITMTAWVLSSDIVWPGDVIRVTVTGAASVSGGRAVPLADLSELECRIQVYAGGGLKSTAYGRSFSVPQSAYGLETPGTAVVMLGLRPADRGGTYVGNGKNRTLTVNAVGVTAGASLGDVPLGWIQAHFPEAATEAMQREYAVLDSDGDGLPNWKEYVAGTDPNDPGSSFAITEFVPRPGQVPLIGWTEMPGRRYTLQGKPSLDGAWGSVGADSRFFRVLVELAE